MIYRRSTLFQQLSILLTYWDVKRKNATLLYQSLWSNCYYFFPSLITPWASEAHLTIQDYPRQRCKTVIVQHSLYLNYDINHHLLFVSLTSFQISQIAESGLVIIIKTLVCPLALEFVHNSMPKKPRILSLYTLSNLIIGRTSSRSFFPVFSHLHELAGTERKEIICLKQKGKRHGPI